MLENRIDWENISFFADPKEAEEILSNCQSCGACCRNELVYLDEEEVKTIESLGYNRENFLKKHSNGNDNYLSTKGDKMNSCYFLDEEDGDCSCRIYENRPSACKLFPFDDKALDFCRFVKLSKEQSL